MRFSKQREAVYNVLSATRSHPDVAYIYNEVRKVIPNISLGTVYRNLQELCQCGRVRKLDVVGSYRFDATVSEHAHFVCNTCGRILDVDCPKMEVADNVQRVEITLYGVCENCQKNSSKNSKEKQL